MAKPKPKNAPAPKIKKSIDFTKPQIAWLRQRAFDLEITVSALVRWIIDKERDA